MSTINKELYDALIEARVSDEKAIATASSEAFMKKDIADIADIKVRLTVIEKLQWAIILGVVGLIIKSFIA